MPRKNYLSGFGEKDPDIDEFLKPSCTDPWDHKASGVGYNATKDDDGGTSGRRDSFGLDDWRGNDPFMAGDASYQGDRDYVHQKLNALIDNDPSLPSGKLNAGGGPLGRTGGVGPGKPRYAPKTGPRRDRDNIGGVSKQGRR